MSINAKTSKSEKNTQDMLVRLMTVARLLIHSDAKKNKRHDTKPDEKNHRNENL